MKIFKWLFISLISILIIGGLAYFSGPKVDFGTIETREVPEESFSVDEIESLVTQSAAIPNLKPDNASRIFWADSTKSRTKWSLVYLHGFSASPEEGDPVFEEVGKRYGMNVYVPLLPGHGLPSAESFVDLTPNQLIKAAKEAIQVGNSIGDSLLLMSCSTGSTLALYLASANPELIDALILYSPNIELADKNAKLLTGPWGKELALALIGPYKTWKKPGDSITIRDNYWTTTYRTEGIVALQVLLAETMKPEVLKAISQPYMAGYYFKNENEMDKTISIAAIQKFHKVTATAPNLKKLVAFPNAGAHVMTSPLQSKDVPAVLDSTYSFVESKLGLIPIIR